MIRTRIAAAMAIALFAATACQQQDDANALKSDAKPTQLKTDVDKQSYSLGFFAGTFIDKNVKGYADADIQLERDKVVAGFLDAMHDQGVMKEDEVRKILTDLDKVRAKNMMAKRKEEAKENAKKSADFLAENGKKEGVTTTESGLQYKVIEAGSGEQPKATDTVTVAYTGKLMNGEVFDSSAQHGDDATFALNQVIPGWTEGVQLMKVGAEYEFVVPPELAYGENGAGQKIPPNSALIFDVKLKGIGQPHKAKTAPSDDQPSTDSAKK